MSFAPPDLDDGARGLRREHQGAHVTPGYARLFAVLGAVFGFLAVAAGAFGAHALRSRLTPGDLEIFETAVRYQMYHALALLALAWVASQWSGTATLVAGWAFVAGTLVFSGSLYVLVLSGARWWGAVTPVGGTALLVGWLALAWALLKAGGGS